MINEDATPGCPVCRISLLADAQMPRTYSWRRQKDLNPQTPKGNGFLDRSATNYGIYLRVAGLSRLSLFRA